MSLEQQELHLKNRMKRFKLSAFYWKGLSALEDVTDKLLTGYSLTVEVQNMSGSTGTQATHYLILRHIFNEMVSISDNDSLIDVGCGEGRVLAYLHRRYPGVCLAGVDFNEASIAVARQWAEKKSISLYCKDALAMDYNPYTVLYLFRPFHPTMFMRFIDHMENTLTHPVKMVYMSDQESGHFLKDRAGWTLLHSEKIFKLHGLQVASSPQGCSVWSFIPCEASN